MTAKSIDIESASLSSPYEAPFQERKRPSSFELFNPFDSRQLFRRCVVCPAGFVAHCPQCQADEICSLKDTLTCEACEQTFCIKLAGTVTTTVSLAPTATNTSVKSSNSGGTTTPSLGGNHSKNAGKVAGVVVGIVLFLLLLSLGTWLYFRRQKSRQLSLATGSDQMRYVPAGGRHELDPSQTIRPEEMSAEQQIFEIDGREKPVEAG
jgi:hypothetical protein